MTETTQQKVLRRARALIEESRKRQKQFQDDLKASQASNGPRPMGYGPTCSDLNSMFLALEDACDEMEGLKDDAPRKKYEAKTLKDGSGFDGEMREEHESFGLIGIGRRSHSGSGTHLFGSHVDRHPTTIILTIDRAQRIHSTLAYDRFHTATENPHVVEVELSAAQFAEMITNPNVGVGFPCTLRSVAGVRMEEVPGEHKSEQTKILENFYGEMKDVEATLKPHIEEAAEILAKNSIGKKDRERLQWCITKIVRLISDHAPWVAKQFGESTEKMETEAKKEIEAYATSVIHAAGLEHLRQQKLTRPTIDVEAVPVEIEGKETAKIEEGIEANLNRVMGNADV